MVNAKNCLTGPMMCIIMGLCLLYIISPIDFLPEAILGPIGLIDDFIAGLGLLLPVFMSMGGIFESIAKGSIGGKKK